MKTIKIGIIGIGNCASSLIQGLNFYKNGSKNSIGLMHWNLGGYHPSDIEVVSAFDIDARKVGRDVSDGIFSPPNCAKVFCESVEKTGVLVSMGKLLDSFSSHMKNYEASETFLLSESPEASQEEIVAILKNSGTEILLNYW